MMYSEVSLFVINMFYFMIIKTIVDIQLKPKNKNIQS